MMPQVPGYGLDRLLGEGAHCRVYLAREDAGLRRPVALKLFEGPAGGASWEAELEVVARVEELRRREREPGIVQALGSGRDGARAWIAFEWLESGSLMDVVAREGPLPAARAAALVTQAARALALLHAEGLFHRDVKPGNLLLGADDKLRLADFGLSRALDGTLSAAGSPAFAAPEVIAGRPGDGRRTDVYSLGATLAYLLTGEAMLPGRPDVFVLERRGVPRPLQEVIVVAMASEPGERFPDAGAFLSALTEASGPVASEPTPPAALEELRASPPPALEERQAAAEALIEKCGYAAAALTLVPIPVSELVAVLPIHVGMVMGLGQIHGVAVQREDATRMLGRIAAAAGLSLLGSRVATTAAKLLLPGLGGLLGAPFMFASTLAIGQVANAQLSLAAAGQDTLDDRDVEALYRERLRAARRAFDPGRARSPEARALAEEAREGPGATLAEELATATPAAPAGRDDPAALLARLADLKSRGLIGDDEHRVAKRKILNEL